ncbi:hypothetical protein M0R36_10635 [bacterium]|jgi:hypothetical protein|nr:hypothetical protein [bacterium]
MSKEIEDIFGEIVSFNPDHITSIREITNFNKKTIYKTEITYGCDFKSILIEGMLKDNIKKIYTEKL